MSVYKKYVIVFFVSVLFFGGCKSKQPYGKFVATGVITSVKYELSTSWGDLDRYVVTLDNGAIFSIINGRYCNPLFMVVDKKVKIYRRPMGDYYVIEAENGQMR